MTATRDGHTGCSRFAFVAVTLMALTAAACGTAASPSSAASATQQAAPQTTRPSLPSVSNESARPSVSAASPLRSLGLAPDGMWTGIHWIAISGGQAPAVPPALFGAQFPTNFIWGSSKGFVEVLWDFHKRTLTPWFSADGLTWRAAGALDTSIWTPYLRSYDATPNSSDPTHDFCHVVGPDLQEGPQALLLTATLLCGGSGEVGGIAYSPIAAWISSNGLSWTPATIPAAITSVSGGASGFVGVGSDGSVWLSQDSRAWAKVTLPPALLKKDVSPCGGLVSLADGFVLAGLVAVKSGGVSQTQGALWWSPDAETWTRDSLGGTVPAEDGDQMCAMAIDAHTVVAELIRSASLTGPAYLASTDGKTWAALQTEPFQEVNGNTILAGRDKGLVFSNLGDSGLYALDGNLALVELKQSGDLPGGSDFVLGPTGILAASDDGTRFWIGVPTVG